MGNYYKPTKLWNNIIINQCDFFVYRWINVNNNCVYRVAYHFTVKRNMRARDFFAFATLSWRNVETVHWTVSLSPLSSLCSEFAPISGSNPLLLNLTKKKKAPNRCFSLFGGEQGIRTLETVLAVYTISNRAPSTSSDNSPYL